MKVILQKYLKEDSLSVDKMQGDFHSMMFFKTFNFYGFHVSDWLHVNLEHECCGYLLLEGRSSWPTHLESNRGLALMGIS